MRRPKMSLSWLYRGCRTVAGRMKAFAIQMYWEEPPMEDVMAGRAVAVMVKSSAEAKEMVHRTAKISQKLKE